MQFTVFLWQNHIHRFGLEATITQTSTQPKLFAKSYPALLIQFIVVRFALGEERRRDLFDFLHNQNLHLQIVPLLFSAVKFFLLFFGHSIKLSVTSTIVYFYASASSNHFLPGKESFPDLNKKCKIT